MATSSDQTLPSSPQLRSQITFSDAITRCSTPPSSPPGFPWEQVQEDAPVEKTTSTSESTSLNAFSVLGKRKPLGELTKNPRPKKQIALSCKQNAAAQSSQMQLSLGQQTRSKCSTCGMEYVPSSIEDRKLHQKYHRQNSEGYDVGDVFVDQTLKPRRMRGLKSGDYVIMVDAFDLHHRKRRAHAALEIVQRELGAVEIPHNDIWKSQPDDLSHRESKYRSYMYIRGTKCIGYLLVEQLDKAYAVLNSAASTDTTTAAAGDKEEKSAKKISALAALRARKEQLAQELADCASQPLKCADVDSPAVMGVSRIWTSPVHRKQNIATALLDAAVKFHNEFAEMSRNLPPPTSDLSPELKETVVPPYKRPNIVRRDQVAFSQPTESGARLARKWIGKAYGWLVYL